MYNPELVEKLVESFKGKDASAATEVIVTASLFLNGPELMGVMESLKSTLKMIMLKDIMEEHKSKKEKESSKDSLELNPLAALLMASLLK